MSIMFSYSTLNGFPSSQLMFSQFVVVVLVLVAAVVVVHNDYCDVFSKKSKEFLSLSNLSILFRSFFRLILFVEEKM